MENFINVAKKVLLEELPHDGVFVNYTMTDGYDTLYMAQYVSEGNVVAFADNKEKIESAYRMLENNFQDNAHIVLDSPLSVEKYVTTDINGFLFDAVNIDMSDKDMIELIRISLKIMTKRRKGVVMLSRAKSKVVKFIENLSESKANVMHLNMANIASPHIFIIEKIG